MDRGNPSIGHNLGAGQHQIGNTGFAGNSDIFFAAMALTRMPMVVSDPHKPDNPLVFANQAFCELTGYTAEQLIGRNCRLLQGPDTDAATVARIREALRRRTDIAVEILNYRNDGRPFWNALFVSPVFGPDGALAYFFASQLDVTRRREAERALIQAQRLEGLGSLAGGVAHEFNNLLTVIRGNLEPLMRDAPDSRSAVRLSRVCDAAERAALLTRSMISFARRQRLEDQSIELDSLLQEMHPALSQAVASDCTVEIAGSPQPVFVHADPEQLRTALINVVLNARDARPRDGVVRLAIQRQRVAAGRPGEVELTVIDLGSGMSPEVAQRAIDPFFTTKQPGMGVGLGLSMAYGFMRQTGGRLEIHSEQGAGTTVRFVFPVHTPTPDYLPQAQAGETLLVVDDDRDALSQAEALLVGLGYQVLAAEHGDGALGLLRGPRRIDLMVTDIAMPGIAGPDLVRWAEQLRPKLPILYVTGFPGESGRPTLGKPFALSELARQVRELLDGGPNVMRAGASPFDDRPPRLTSGG